MFWLLSQEVRGSNRFFQSHINRGGHILRPRSQGTAWSLWEKSVFPLWDSEAVRSSLCPGVRDLNSHVGGKPFLPRHCGYTVLQDLGSLPSPSFSSDPCQLPSFLGASSLNPAPESENRDVGRVLPAAQASCSPWGRGHSGWGVRGTPS